MYDATGTDDDFVADYVFDLVGNRLHKHTDTNADPTPDLTAEVFGDYRDGDPMLSANIDEAIDYLYDANDRLQTEIKDAPGTADDRYTKYDYGASDEKTQQIKTSVWNNLTGTGSESEITAYGYNLQGRMTSADVDLDADDFVDRREEYEYDDSGIRVAKTEKIDTDDDGTVDTTTRTDYHVDKQNHTGYAQVLEEMQGDVVQKSWTIGHDVFLEAVVAGQLRHLLKDGHGSTRQLVDATGAVINSGTAQVFAYDAYGVPIGFTLANALTTLLYSGEMTD